MNQNTPQQQMPPGHVIRGGSASDRFAKGGNAPIGILKHGNILFPTGKKARRLYRLMPARDMSLSPQDGAFLTSVAPYRDRNARTLDDDTKTIPFTDWFFGVQVHRRVGRSKAEFVSPTFLAMLGLESGTRVCDPLIDCCNVAQASNNPQWIALTKKVEGTGGGGQNSGGSAAVLPFQASGMYAMCALFSDSGLMPQTFAGNSGVLMLSPTAFTDFKQQLSWPTTAQAPARDAKFPEFLFGDLTSPECGLGFWAEKRQIGTVSPWALRVSPADYQASQVLPLPLSQIAPGHELQLLADRVNLFDIYNTWNIPSQQEIVDWMIGDGAFPHEIIRAACGHYANVSAANNVTFAAAQTFGAGAASPAGWQPQGQAAPASWGPGAGGAPPTGFPPVGGSPTGFPTPGGAPGGFPPMGAGAAAPMWPTSQQLPNVEAPVVQHATPVLFWTTIPGATSPLQKSQQEIEAMPADQFNQLQVTPDSAQPWQHPAVYGLVCHAATPPPVPAMAPMPPMAPHVPQAPPMPQAQPTYAPQPAQQAPAPTMVPVVPTVPQHFAQPAYATPAQQAPVMPTPQPPPQGQPQPGFGAGPPQQFVQPQLPVQNQAPVTQSPQGVPPTMPGAPGPGLSAEEAAELTSLMGRVSTQPQTLTQADYTRLAELTRRGPVRPPGT